VPAAARAAAPPGGGPRGARRRALARDYQTLTTWEQLDDWIARLKAAPLTGLDTETDSLDPMRAHRRHQLRGGARPGRLCAHRP
jgi:DNA polymerase-1